MVNFAVCVRKCRKDGLWPVYIRITLRRQVAYLKTDKLVVSSSVTKGGRITDRVVMRYCQDRIDYYCQLLNQMVLTDRTVNEIRDLLANPLDMSISFTDFANDFINSRIAVRSEGNANLYRAALNSFLGVFAGDDVKFSDITVRHIKFWIKKLEGTKRAKESYPICVRQIWKSARRMFGDMYDDAGFNPLPDIWGNIDIPQSELSERMPLSAEECRVFFSAPIPGNQKGYKIAKLGRDVAMMVLCLAGINTVDLYNMKRANYVNGRLCYNRAKTAGRRFDHAYIEIAVPEILKPIISEYFAPKGIESLFVFSQLYTSAKTFNITVNAGLKQMCSSISGLERRYTSYLFRHTWATTAQNDCGASFSDIGFALNHMNENRVTRGYVKPDFSKIWDLNERVIDFIFFSDIPSKRNLKGCAAEADMFQITPRVMLRAAAFFRGRRLADFEDMGFRDVDEVISALIAMLPDDIPQGSMVQFKIVNLDTDQVGMYERMKGNGF